jgi:DnaJ-class molecular chaperone
MPPQLKVLIPLFVIFIAIFVVIRHFLVPVSFGEYGHYRGNSLIDNANREIVYSTKETCIECHPDINEKLQSDLHAHLSCVVCHGPGLEHANSPDASNIIKLSGRDHCGRCHGLNPARAKDAITQIDVKAHHIEKDNCIECHNPHQVWELKE